MQKLPRDFYARDAVTVAKDLLGKVLVRETPEGVTAGIIVETEAYRGVIDKASHAFGDRRTARTQTMYGPPGHAYVFLIYGMYSCVNVVTMPEGTPEAVLVRALAPVEGIEIMEIRRKTDKIKNLCSGPGKLCNALAITRADDGADLCDNKLYIVYNDKGVKRPKIIASKRINIDYAEEAVDFKWRFTIKDSPFISVKLKSY